MPPRAIAGRWGSVTACEAYMINIGGVQRVGQVGGYNNKSNQPIKQSIKLNSDDNPRQPG